MKPTTTVVARAALSLAAGFAFAAAANAQSGESRTPAQNMLEGSLVLEIGGFLVGTDVRASLQGQSTNNPAVDFDDTFGKADDTRRGRLDFLWRINPNHHLRFMYFNNDVSRSRVIDRNVQWGDVTYTAGGNVTAETKFDVYELAYEYAFVRKPTYELNGSLGVHYMDLSLALSGVATVTGGGGGTTSSFTRSSNSVSAPLPVIGFRAGWAVAPQWYIDAQAQVFKVKVEGVDGRWTDMRVGATWMFHRNWGVGLGWNRFVTDVDVTKTDYNGSVRLGYSGAQLFLTATY